MNTTHERINFVQTVSVLNEKLTNKITLIMRTREWAHCEYKKGRALPWKWNGMCMQMAAKFKFLSIFLTFMHCESWQTLFCTWMFNTANLSAIASQGFWSESWTVSVLCGVTEKVPPCANYRISETFEGENFHEIRGWDHLWKFSPQKGAWTSWGLSHMCIL